MKTRKNRLLFFLRIMIALMISMQLINSSIVFAQSGELVYIPVDFIDNLEENSDITSDLNWDYVGSAQTVSKNIVKNGDEKYLSLSSDAIKNGGYGGSYYLYSTYYPITGEGVLDFDVRLNSGKMKLSIGDEIVTSSLYHGALTMEFDADTGKITCNNIEIPYVFDNINWYKISFDFDVNNKSFDLSIKDGSESVLFEEMGIAFEEAELFHITNMTFSYADSSPFSFDVDNLNYVNKNTQNSSGGYMSISDENIMQSTYPDSAAETSYLIDNQKYLPRRMEYLDRGLVAVKRTDDVYLSWRWLGTEDIKTGYNIYRDGVKINSSPIIESTNYVDKDGTLNSKYVVKSVIDGVEVEESEEVNVNQTNALTIPLKQYDYENYSSGDGMVGDLDGDGEYEIVVHRYPEDVFTSTNYPLIEAYKLDGTLLWSMNIGPNDLEPKQNPVMLYDLNDDGKSEVVLRIGDDFIDGEGVSVGDMDGDEMTNYRDYVYSEQYLTKGPEYLAVFDGLTGGIIDKVPFEGVIARDPLISWGNGNSITHRPWKFMFTPLKIDDEGTAFIISRGIYAKTGIQCWKLIDNKLVMQWDFDSNNYFAYTGQGNHNLTSGDVDYDGYDEIIYGSMGVDHDGSPLFTTHLGHGDALHLGDFDIDRPGLEVVKTNENSTAYANGSMYDARTGEVLWGEYAARDTTRVICDDIDPRYRGGETYTNGKAFDSKGNIINSQGGGNFMIYWDGDLLRELNDDITISKYMAYDDKVIPLFIADDCHSNNGTKANCTIQCDILGDWREEVVLPTADGKSLKVFTTTCPTTYKLYTLTHDPIYRLAIAWQNNAYNQPPHLGFYWGYDVESIPIPQIYTVKDGVKTYSPYSDDYKKYEVGRKEESFYADENSSTVLVDEFPRLTYQGTQNNTEASEETMNLLPYITKYYDDALKYGGLTDYVTLPTTKVYLPTTVRFVTDENITVTDINDVPIENLCDDINYDEVNKLLTVSEDKNLWIKVKGESFTQIFNIKGGDYQREDTFLYDTLDVNALGSGSDFLDSRMNINGWKLNGDSDNVSVITYADSSFTGKKRMVHIKNNSQSNAEFYLDRPEFITNGSIVAEFDVQLRYGESEVVLWSGEDNKKSLSIKQVGNALYAGSMGEYKLIAENLETTEKNGAVYHIISCMDFDNKVSDIMVLKDDNVIGKLEDMPFYSSDEKSLSKISVMVTSGSEFGIDDIDISVYSGIYVKRDDTNSVILSDGNMDVKDSAILISKYDNGALSSLNTFNTGEEITIDSGIQTGIYVWNDLLNMTPIFKGLVIE